MLFVVIMNIDRWLREYESKSLTDQYTFVIDSLNEGMSTDLIEENGLVDLFLELKGELELQKRFDEIIKLIHLLQDSYIHLYKNEFQFFDEFLVSYYCYHNQKDALMQSLNNFIENPVQGIDNFMVAITELIFNDQLDLIDQFIDDIYLPICDSPGVIYPTAEELALIKFYECIEQLDTNKPVDKKTLTSMRKYLERHDYNLDESYLKKIKQNLNQDMITGVEAVEQFRTNRKDLLVRIELKFLQYMAKKDFHFVQSAKLWNNMAEYWNRRLKTPRPDPNQFFALDKQSFDKYIYDISGSFILENSSEALATLWGSVYIYDYLKSIQLIDDHHYKKAMITIHELKKEAIQGFYHNLWKSSFICNWTKPDSISEEQFEKCKKTFLESYHTPFSEGSNVLGMQDEYIKTINSTYGSFEQIKYDYKGQRHRLKKIGRNDLCPCGSGKKYKKCCGKKM